MAVARRAAARASNRRVSSNRRVRWVKPLRVMGQTAAFVTGPTAGQTAAGPVWRQTEGAAVTGDHAAVTGWSRAGHGVITRRSRGCHAPATRPATAAARPPHGGGAARRCTRVKLPLDSSNRRFCDGSNRRVCEPAGQTAPRTCTASNRCWTGRLTRRLTGFLTGLRCTTGPTAAGQLLDRCWTSHTAGRLGKQLPPKKNRPKTGGQTAAFAAGQTAGQTAPRTCMASNSRIIVKKWSNRYM